MTGFRKKPRREVSEREAELWFRYRRDRAVADRNELVMIHLGFAYHQAELARRRLPKRLGADEIRQWAVLGLIDAVERFRPELGLRFATYATSRVRGEIVDQVRRLRMVPHCAARKGAVEPVVRRLDEDVAGAEETESLPCLDRMTRGLSGREREAIRLYYAEGLNHRQIGERIGVCAARVCRLLQEALGWLRELGLERILS